MEDEDDSYGFGSFADLFESGEPGERATSAGSQLDLEASRHLWMSRGLFERLTANGKVGGAYQHVGAKIGGFAVEGGLGRLRLVENGEDLGVAWMQATRSDSNAQEKRRRVLEGDDRSATAIFVPVKSIEKVEMTKVQNRVQAVELLVEGGQALQFAFLPGPYFNAEHCEEFMNGVRQLLNKAANGSDDDAIEQLLRRDEMRERIRRYTRLDQFSEEAIQIARQVHDFTGYPIGPLATKVPRFASDVVYRKKAVQELTKFLSKMNEEWARADEHRELHTQTKSFRNQDELFQYTDTVTGDDVSPRSYESRYSVYAKLDDHNPFILSAQHSDGGGEGLEFAAMDFVSYKSELSVLLGVDVAASCIIDESFFTTNPAADDEATKSNKELPPGLETVGHVSWPQWEELFQDCIKDRGSAVRRHEMVQADRQSPSRSALKRPRDRRRSIAPPPLHELIDLTSEEQPASGRSLSPGKRRHRSQSPESKPPATAKKRSRRQSITGSVDTSVLEEQQDVVVIDGDLNECRLCFGEDAVIEMAPCGHRVCTSCWGRLAGSDGGRLCPWDREPVARIEK